jgi:hypothetical protein
MKQLSCEQAKQIDMVDYLASLNYRPDKIHNDDYWYLSPLRNEKTPSFKVNREKNVWYDHGTGKGGDIIDFGTLYHNCSVSELLNHLSAFPGRPLLSFHPPSISGSPAAVATLLAGEKKEANDSKIVILDARPLAAKHLLNYLKTRSIPLEIASRYCKEVDFLLYGKQHTVIGFQNNGGGYELRNENFKGSSSPKDITFIDNDCQQVAVFEGFFSYLAFQTLSRNQVQPQANFLILNSLSFFEKSRKIMETHREVHLLLDKDTAGISNTQKALAWDNNKYMDRSAFYNNRKDLNDWLIHHEHSLQHYHRRGRRL